MRDSYKRSLRFIIQHYGRKSQEEIAIEECSELVKAIIKLRRGKGTVEELVDELADVQIMTDQLKLIYHCEEEVMARIDDKVSRQLLRMDEGE